MTLRDSVPSALERVYPATAFVATHCSYSTRTFHRRRLYTRPGDVCLHSPCADNLLERHPPLLFPGFYCLSASKSEKQNSATGSLFLPASLDEDQAVELARPGLAVRFVLRVDPRCSDGTETRLNGFQRLIPGHGNQSPGFTFLIGAGLDAGLSIHDAGNAQESTQHRLAVLGLGVVEQYAEVAHRGFA